MCLMCKFLWKCECMSYPTLPLADTSGSKEIWINGDIPLRFLIDMQKGSKCGNADFCTVSPWRNTPV